MSLSKKRIGGLIGIALFVAMVSLFGVWLLMSGEGRYLLFRIQCSRSGGIAERRDDWLPTGMTVKFLNVCHAANRPADVGKICTGNDDCLGRCERDVNAPGYHDDVLSETDVYRCTDILFYQAL